MNIVVISHVICHVTVNYCPIGGRFKKRNRAITFFFFILNISNTSRLEWLSIALQGKIMRKNIILNAQTTSSPGLFPQKMGAPPIF